MNDTPAATRPGVAFPRFSGKTRLVALLGSPVSHSRSPRLQNGVYEALGVDLAYLAFDVPLNRLEQAVLGLRALDVHGAAVTMPLKRAICAYLDKLSPAAELAGAVNTVVNEGGVLTGHITDGVGYVMSLQDVRVQVEDAHVTMVGVGGAATAVAIELAMKGAKRITLFNTRDGFFESGLATVELLRSRLACDAALVDLADAQRLKASMAASDLFINATPIGMEETVNQSVVPDASFFHRRLVVTDLIYAPERTRLLAMAQAAGCSTLSGIGMQLFQGAEQFRLWTGKTMPIDLARELLADRPNA